MWFNSLSLPLFSESMRFLVECRHGVNLSDVGGSPLFQPKKTDMKSDGSPLIREVHFYDQAWSGRPTAISRGTMVKLHGMGRRLCILTAKGIWGVGFDG